MELEKESLLNSLREAWESCIIVKEHYVAECDFDNATRFRDYGETIKKLIRNIENEPSKGN